MLRKDHRDGGLVSVLPQSEDVRRRQDHEAVAEASTVPERRANRTANGRFAPGNDAARQRALRQTITKALGRVLDASKLSAEGKAVSDDAWRLFCASLSELPDDGANVRSLVAAKARHEALAAFWAAKSGEYDLTSQESLKAQEQAAKNAERAARLSIQAIDVAQRLALLRAKEKRGEALPWLEDDSEAVPGASQVVPSSGTGGNNV